MLSNSVVGNCQIPIAVFASLSEKKILWHRHSYFVFFLSDFRLPGHSRHTLALRRLNLDLAQLQHHLLRTSLLTSPSVQYLCS